MRPSIPAEIFRGKCRSCAWGRWDEIAHYIFIFSVSAYADLSYAGVTENSRLAALLDPNYEKVTVDSYGPLKGAWELGSKPRFTWVSDAFLAKHRVAEWPNFPFFVSAANRAFAGMFRVDRTAALQNRSLSGRDLAVVVEASTMDEPRSR
jgi:hypothetical protein